MYHKTSLNTRSGGSGSSRRIRTGFGRPWPPPYFQYDQQDGLYQHPNFGGFDEADDPFTPIIISNDSGSTVCSGITMDEALLTDNSSWLPSSSRSHQERPKTFSIQKYLLKGCDDATAESIQEEIMAPAPKSPTIRHTQLATSPFMTTPHNIQADTPVVIEREEDDEEEGEEQELDEEMEDIEGWGDIQDINKPHVMSFHTEATGQSSEEEEEELKEIEVQIEGEKRRVEISQDHNEGFPVNVSATGSASSSNRNISIRLEDFDTDHLTIFEDSIYNSSDEDSCDEEEASIVRKLENNATELYWLQLTTALTDSTRLSKAMLGNTAVRNVTVYPSAIENLPHCEQKAVVDAICQLKNLKNLIVFQDCGNLFVDPLIRYRPPLTRLTLYKLDVSGDSLFSKLVMLLVGLHGLEEISLEKFKGDDGCRLLKAVAKVLPSMKSLKSLSMTPSRGVKLNRDGPQALFRALGANKTIRTLSLQGSADSIDQRTITELANTLRTNTTLEDVKLTGFWKSEDAFWKRFSEKTTTQINYHLGLNKAGIRNLQMDINTDFETLKNVIVGQKDNLEHVYYLVSQNPSIVKATIKK